MAVKDVEAKKGQRTRQVYDLLVADGADVGSFGEFNRWLYSEGERGYENRRRVYEAFKTDGADVGSYDEFRDWLNGGGGTGAAAQGQAQTTAATKPVATAKPVGAAQAAAAVAPKEVAAPKPAAKAAVKPAGQGKNKAQAGMAVGRMYSMRSGGKDFQVSEADVVSAGGFDAWAAQNASRYKDLRVYMRNAKGERVHTDVGNVKQRAADGWWAEALPKKRGEAKAYQGERTSVMSSDDVFHTPFSFDNTMRRNRIKMAGGVPETELFPVVGESKGEPGQGGGSAGAVSAGSVKDAKAVGVEVDAATGEKRTVYELPDGSRTTDISDVTRSLGGTLKTRVSRTYEREFKQRMKGNGLDPENERDVQIQQIDDRISENERKLKRINAERERKLQEYESAGSEWDRFVHMVGGAAQRYMAAHAPQVEQNLSEEDHVIKDLIAENLMLTQQGMLLKSSKDLKKAEGMWNGTFDVKNNVRNLYAGVRDKLMNPDLYAMGAVALHNGERLERIKSKLESGGELTGSELNLAESAALIGRSAQYVDLPHMYTAGQITTEMIPFMVQMAANPASGLSRGLVKKYGNTMAKRIGLAIAGDVAEAAVLTNTLQAPKTVADIQQRHRGDIIEREPGQFAFEGGESWAKAIAKGEGASVIENYTELLGTHFGVISSAVGKGAAAVGRKVGLGNVMAKAGALVNNIRATDVAKGLAKVEKKANWNGVFGEVLEEEAGIVLNALTVGDNSLSDLVDAEQQIDIILGVGLFGGFLAGVKTAAYPAERMMANIELIDTERVGAYRFGDNWDTIKNRIESADDRDLATVVRGLVVDYCESKEMAQSVMKYAQALVKARGFNLAKVAVDRENAEKNGGKVDSEAMREQAVESLAENSILENYENEAQGEPAGPGLNADGSPMEAVGRAVMKFENRPVEVLSGRVAMMDDGSMVDNANSDRSIVIRDVETGKVEMVAPDAILSYEDYASSSGDGEHIPDGGNMMASDEASADVVPEDADSGLPEEMDMPRYGAGSIVVRDAAGALSRGWLTGEVVTEDNYAELGLSRDDIGKYEYYLEGNLNELAYASEQELDAMVSEFVPDDPVADDVLNSEENDVSLQEFNNSDENGEGFEQSTDAEGVQYDGSGVVGDSAGEMEVTRNRGDIRMYENGIPVEQDGDSRYGQRNRREAESERLVGIAREQGHYIPKEQWGTLGVKRTKASGESVVYDNHEADGRVYKVKDPFAKAPLKGNVQPEEVIYEHLVHNKYFPETEYRFEGVSDELGDVRIVLSQPYIASVGTATKELVEAALAEKGLFPEGNYRYGNDEVSVTDVTGDNALVGEDGRVYFIDPIIDFKRPALEILGESVGREAEESADDSTENPVSDAKTVPEAVSTVENIQQTPLQSLPRDEAGNPVFEQAESPELAWDALVEFSDGDVGAAQEVADLMVDEKRKAFEKAQKLKSKGKNPAEILASRKANQAVLAQARGEFEMWQKIASVERERQEAERRQREAEARAAKEAEAAWQEQKRSMDRRVREVAEDLREYPEAIEILNDMEPHDIWEVASVVLSEHKVLLGDSGVRRGAMSEVGLGRGESRGLIGLFARYENGGRSIEALSEDYMKQECEAHGVPYEQGEARDALIELINSARTRGDIYGYIAGNRIEQAREVVSRMEAAQENAKAEYYRNMFGLDVEQGEAYEEQIMAELAEAAHDFDEQAYNELLADEMDDLADAYEDFAEQQVRKALENLDESEYNGNIADSDLFDKEYEDYERRRIEEDDPAAEGSGVGRGGEVLSGQGADNGAGEAAYASGRTVSGTDGASMSGQEAYVGGTTGATGRGNVQSSDERKEGEVDEHGKPFIIADDGTTIFGQITDDSGLTPAPIKLSEGFQDVNTGKGYGLMHMEANHGEQIRQAGFSSVQEFVSFVAKNYDIDNIRVGKRREDGSGTFLIQVTDKHENTLFIELSKDGSYWGVNSGGVFRKGYSHKKETVAKTEPQQPNNAVSSDSSLPTDEPSGTSSIEPNGEPTVSNGKGKALSSDKQISEGEKSDNSYNSNESDKASAGAESVQRSVQAAVETASAQVNISPTPAQVEAGNYKKGHVRIGGFDISIENPAGSVRRGVDANGKEWQTTMANAYGDIKGTESVDGDPIDVFLHTDMDRWNGQNVYVVDQTNEDGSFDEHKVMLGFNDKAEALSAYLANYDASWAQTHPGLRISEVNTEDFNKWIKSSKRKSKPFADYSTVSKITDDAPTEPQKNDGFTIEARKDTRDNSDIYAVKFDERVSREEFKGQKAIAKKHGGYWSNFGKKGFLFKNEADAKAFAAEVIGKSENDVADQAPLSMTDIGTSSNTHVKKIDHPGVAGELHKKGETNLSYSAAPIEHPNPKKRNKWISDEDAAEFNDLRNNLRSHLGADDNIAQEDAPSYGKPQPKQMDAEVLRMGTRMTYLMMKGGLRKFYDYAGAMVDEIGDAIRPHLKSLYAAAQNMEEVIDLGWDEAMDDRKTVKTFDVYNFDKTGAKDIFATARHIVDEQTSQEQTDKIIKVLKEERNEKRKQNDGEKPLSPVGDEDYVALASRAAKNSVNREKRQKANAEKQSAEKMQKGLFDMNENDSSKDNITESKSHEKTDLQSRPKEAGRGGEQPRPNESLGKGAANEDERTDGTGVVGRSGVHTVSDTERDGSVSRPDKSERGISQPKNTRNNHAERGVEYAPKGEKARIEANIAAIEVAKGLLESDANATPEEMAVLRRYSGWGGLGSAFNERNSFGKNQINKRLRELLSQEEYDAAVMSRNSAYYTPAPVIDALWNIAKGLGFKGGNILEGSAGIGNIIGLMPSDISERSNIHAVEIDSTTGGILSLLYPDAKVEVQGFEKTRIPNGSIDLAITNVPFVTGLHVMDESGDSDLSKKFRDIHDFCIAKNVRKLREGGIGIFITSSGTLDKSQKLRNWLVAEKDGNTDVVGVFRMHNKTFGGTAATSDIIVVRKRVNGRKNVNSIDVSSVSALRTVAYENEKGKTKDLPLLINRYFIEHPENMGGEMFFGFEQGDTFRPTSMGLFPIQNANQSERMNAWVNALAEMNWKDEVVSRSTEQSAHINEALGENVKEGSMILDNDNNLCVARMGHAVPIVVNKNKIKGHTKQECFTDYSEIKSALDEVLKYQTEHADDTGLQPLLDRLNRAYDSFVEKYGNLNRNSGLAWLRNNDIDYPSIAALETVSERGSKDGKKVVSFAKTDIFSRRVVDKESEPAPKNVKDGIIASLYKFGRIDTVYISEQLGRSDAEVKQEIIESGLGFENPTTGQMEVSYEYLSGNVREKLRQARDANVTANGAYDANIKALEAVVPMNIPTHLIEFTLGSSWIAPKLYEKYVKERTDLAVILTNVGGTWHMNEPYYTSEPKNKEMGIRSELLGILIPGHKLIEAAITNKTITVSKTYRNSDGSSETVRDPSATAACAAKVDEIRQDFKDWAREQMQSDPDMSMRMEEIYNEQFNNSVPKTIPDEFIPEHFGGAATMVGGKPFRLRSHQAKAVIRATTQPVLLAHEVGTGKTYTLITTAMEMRRLGTARKPMIVVQNATVGQFVASAKALYPNAKVLTLEDADRNAEGRKAFYAKIKFNDWDMIVVPQSVFEKIPDSIERQTQFIQDKIEEKLLVLEQMKEADPDGNSMIIRQAEREIEKCNAEIAQLANGGTSEKKKEKDAKKDAVTKQNAEVKAREMLDRETDDVEDFDSMGIDAILVDEAHEYKHLGFTTAMERGVKGVDPSYSKKSQGVFLKTQAVLEKTGGKNVVFATGTPISNTAAEIWTFMRYLMPADVMKDYGIYFFDDFVRNFGNLQQMLEFSTSGKYKENNRFAGYVNLPELVRIWSTVADTVLTRDAGGVSDKIPKMEGDKAQDIFLPQTRALRAIMKYVKSELDAYDNMSGKEKKENSHIPLVMYGIAKAAAVDARLVQADAVDDPNSKTNEAVRQTLRSLEDTKDYKGTVAIFADNYQNKANGFNLYDDIRNKLVEAGVPEEQVVVIRSGMTVKKKLEIFDKVNAGEIRVVMGSTFTLGTGVNIQERLHTLIHLDAPNRPMDYTQRNGRILRQGNLHRDWNQPVRVLRFGVEDSLDVTAYQRLKTKGAIADSIMNGKSLMENSMESRSLEEEQDLFGDITAQLSGSEYALLKNQIEKEVRKLTAKLKAWEADQTYIHNRKRQITGQNKEAAERIAKNKGYLAKVEAATVGEITVGKQSFTSVDVMEDFFSEQNKKKREAQEQVRTAGYGGRTATMDITLNIGGFDFKVHTDIKQEMKQSQGTLFASAPTKMTYSCPELGIEAMPVKENLIKNAVVDILKEVVSGKGFRERIEAAERSIERGEAELKSMETRDGVPFKHSEELAKAEEKLAEYEELMKKEMEAKEAKYADMDNDVEAASGIEYTQEDEGDGTTSEPESSFSSKKNGTFANRYETEEGKEINYTSEAGTESYHGLFDFDFSAENPRGTTVYSRARADGVRLEDNPGRTEPGSGLNTAKGEFAVVERIFKETGSFSFTSGERIESADDVAFIFSALEDAAKEHTFAVYVKEGKPTVVELGMGAFNASIADIPTASLAYNRIKPDEVYFVHNHPSGNLKCSPQDAQLLQKMQEMSDVPVHGIIINLKTGKYGTFDVIGNSGEGLKRVPSTESALTIHTLDKQIFAADYDPMAQPLVTSPQAVAEFLNSHRMGDRAKVSFLIVSQQGRIVGNIHTPFSDISTSVRDKARYISDKVVQFGGASAILYGDFDMNDEQGGDYRRLKNQLQQVGNTRLLDVVRVEGNHTRSAIDEGVLYEPGSEYGVSEGMKSDNSYEADEASAGADERMRQREMSESSEAAKSGHVEKLSEKFNTPIRIVRDVAELTHSDAVIQGRMRASKGFYNPVTGEVVLVLPNNATVEDVAATVLHEVVAHKGLRELIGEENYDVFCDEVYKHLKYDLKRQIDEETTRRFIDEPGKGYEHHRRVTVDELFGRMSEKGFEDFTQAERGIWAKLKAMVLEAINKFLGSLKLPKWVKLGDNELRYMLWRSHENLRGKGDFVDVARDVVKRQELGLDSYAVMRDGKGGDKKSSWRDKAALKHLEPINSQEHSAKVIEKLESAKKELKILADNYRNTTETRGFLSDLCDSLGLIRGESGSGYRSFELRNGNVFTIRVSNHNVKARNVGDNPVVSVVLKSKRSNNSFEPMVGKSVDEYVYMKEDVQKAPVGTLSCIAESISEMLETGRYVDRTGLAKENHSGDLRFRDGETGDIWNDRSVGLDERITNAAVRLARNQGDDLTLRNDAMRAIGGNLTKLRRAMAAQKRYDRSTVKRVADLARILMQNGYLSGMSGGEVQRLLSAVKNSVGEAQVEQSVQKVMDIMIQNQLRNAEATLRSLLSIKGSKVDARGVEVQGALDVTGQRTMEVVKKAMTLKEDDINDRIADALNRMSDADAAIADNAAVEYAGLNMALDYVQNIAGSKADEKTLRDSLRTVKEDKDAGRISDEAYKEFVEATEDAMRKNRIERAEAYFNLVGRLSDSLRGSIENAKAFREAEKARVNEIHHNANSDMEGRASNEHHKDDWKDRIANNAFVQGVFAPLGTFDQILRVFGNKSANGEGYLWNRFMRGWVDSRNKELTGVKEKFALLDEKAAELFGKRQILGKGGTYWKDRTWGDIIRMEGKLPKATVSFMDGGQMREHELAQGNLLYIYMVNKMSDGRMKLRRMGITQDAMDEIERVLDPRFKALGDWLQDEFLADTRNEYNETHKRMFGASMAAIENYFPLKILANARIDKEDDVNQQNRPDGITTKTGSIIKRRVNGLALDITGADALSVILDHITQMEHWNAYAEWNRDLNTLRTYKHFRNQVMNMTTVYGGGRKLWDNFNDLCLMAAGEYKPPVANLDKSAVNIAKGVTAAKVSLRMFTALKQFLSAPAYAPEVSVASIAKSVLNPYGDFKWCMENLPVFRERWSSRISGDPRLLKSDMDWKMWRSRVMELSARVGMTPNAFVDALTVSIGARAMYETRLKRYLKEGYSLEDAEKRAKQDATILFNQTQQSSESPFLSTMQVDRSWLSVLFTVFRNSSMSYTRQEFDALRNLKRNLTEGQRARSVEFMTKQILRDWGLDPQRASADERAKAEGAAKGRFSRQLRKDVIRVATFGFILQLAWNLGAYLPYMIFGGDDDEKDKMWDDALTHAWFGSVEGLTGGDVMSAFGNMAASGEWSRFQLTKDMPLASDVNSIIDKFVDEKDVSAYNDIINLVVQSGIGVNPQSITDAVVAVMDACGDDPALSREAAMLVMRVLQVPQSQLDKMYFDEIGMTAAAAGKFTPGQLAKRYAEYKLRREAPLTGGLYSKQELDSLSAKRGKKVLDGVKDAMETRVSTDRTRELVTRYDSIQKMVRNMPDVDGESEQARNRRRNKLKRELYGEMNRREQRAVKSYKKDMKELGEQFMRAESVEQMRNLSRMMMERRDSMLQKVGR